MKVIVIKNRSGDPYLVRFNLITLFGWSIKLHVVLRSDDDREPHDHPWSFWTLILAGGYYEHFLDTVKAKWKGDWDGMMTKSWYGPWSFRYCKAPYAHRLELKDGQPCVTLVLMKPRKREWGFYCKNGRWIQWKKFLDKPAVCEE